MNSGTSGGGGGSTTICNVPTELEFVHDAADNLSAPTPSTCSTICPVGEPSMMSTPMSLAELTASSTSSVTTPTVFMGSATQTVCVLREGIPHTEVTTEAVKPKAAPCEDIILSAQLLAKGSVTDLDSGYCVQQIIEAPSSMAGTLQITPVPAAVSMTDSVERANSNFMSPRHGNFNLRHDMLDESDFVCSDTVIILVPHVCDGITVKSSADVNKDTVQDGQGLPNTEDMMQISGHIIPDQMESGNESHSSNSITPTLKQLVFSQINFGAVHMQFSGPWHQVPVYWAFPCSSGYSWDVPYGSCSSLKSKESSTMSWFQFCPAGKAQLYSYDAVHIQWEIAWSTTTLAYSIQYGCVKPDVGETQACWLQLQPKPPWSHLTTISFNSEFWSNVRAVTDRLHIIGTNIQLNLNNIGTAICWILVIFLQWFPLLLCAVQGDTSSNSCASLTFQECSASSRRYSQIPVAVMYDGYLAKSLHLEMHLLDFVVMRKEAVLWPMFQSTARDTAPLLPWDPGALMYGVCISFKVELEHCSVGIQDNHSLLQSINELHTTGNIKLQRCCIGCENLYNCQHFQWAIAWVVNYPISLYSLQIRLSWVIWNSNNDVYHEKWFKFQIWLHGKDLSFREYSSMDQMMLITKHTNQCGMELQIGRPYCIDIFFKQALITHYLNLVKVFPDYDNHRDIIKVLKHRVQWDPGGFARRRLGVKSKLKEGGLSATFRTLSSWAGHWAGLRAANAGLGPHQSRSRQLLQMTGEGDRGWGLELRELDGDQSFSVWPTGRC